MDFPEENVANGVCAPCRFDYTTGVPPREGQSRSGKQPGAGIFAITHWSVVRAARDGEAPRVAEAFEKLCHAY